MRPRSPRWPAPGVRRAAVAKATRPSAGRTQPSGRTLASRETWRAAVSRCGVRGRDSERWFGSWVAEPAAGADCKHNGHNRERNDRRDFVVLGRGEQLAREPLRKVEAGVNENCDQDAAASVVEGPGD